MIEPNFMEDMDCGNFFDQIDDFLDFPSEDLEAALGTGDFSSFPEGWPTPSDSLPDSDPLFSGKVCSDASPGLFVPYEDIVQLEWLSSFTDDSSAAGKSITTARDSPSHGHFRTLSPVSVLESSSSCSATKPAMLDAPHSPEAVASPAKRGRPRTKRPRPAKPQLSEKPEAEDKPLGVSLGGETRLVIRIPKRALADHDAAEKTETKKNKKKKKKIEGPFAAREDGNEDEKTAGAAVRKCAHCESTKTPQWRAGPTGPKTLCNACGVRYKSGRLFPEYRPAASPTFVPSIHSNSHKKVVEMRTKMHEAGVEQRMSSLGQVIPNEGALKLDHA